MQLLSTIALLGAAQGLMLVLSILSIPFGNRRANQVLAAFIAVVSLRLGLLALEYQPGIDHRPFQSLFALLHLSYALGPLLYFYVQLLVNPQWRLNWNKLWHFTPVLVAAILLLPGGPLLPIDAENYRSFQGLPEHLQTRVELASTPVFISLIIYSLLALRYLGRFQHTLKQQFSAIESINLRWLSALIWLCLLFAMLSILSELYRTLSGGDIGPRVIYSVLCSVLLIYYIGLMGLRQPQILDQGERLEPQPPDDSDKPDSTAEQKMNRSPSIKSPVSMKNVWRRCG